MKAFLAKYTGLTHSIAVVWGFLSMAYAFSPEFQSTVNADAIDIYHSLPPALGKIVGELIALAVPLWAFYRHGQTASGLESSRLALLDKEAASAPPVKGL